MGETSNIMKDITVILAAILLATVSTLQAASASWSPNIVFILADDLGYGDVGCYNPQSRIKTPNIDRLAAEGMRLTDAHAPASTCVPSRYGLLTGRFPFRTWSSKGQTIRKRHGEELLHYEAPMLQHDPARLNLASLMKRNGYATACIGKWHQGMSSKPGPDGVLTTTPVDFGFDYYFGFDAPEQGPYAFIENKRFVTPLTGMIPEHFGQDVTNPKTQGAHWGSGMASADWDFEQCLPRLAGKADDWVTRHTAAEATKPFFLYYAIPAPHAPWEAANEFRGKSGAGQYGDYVMTVDAMVGRLLGTLDKLHLKEKTLVCLSSDNGPVWYPRDISCYDHRAAGPWRGMKGDLHEGGHRVPFIARWPGKIHPGTSSDQLICLTDMIATYAAMVGDDLPEATAEDSLNILPLLLGQPRVEPIRSSMVHPNAATYTVAIRRGDWKLILPQSIYTVKDRAITPDHIVDTTDDRSKPFELYNLRTDPAETINLAHQEPEKVRELFATLKAQIERGRTRPSTKNP